MEFIDKGKHCHDELCRQFDFLPLKCEYCNHAYCKDHFWSHKCNKDKINKVPCPICNEMIHVNNMGPDYAIERHIQAIHTINNSMNSNSNRSSYSHISKRIKFCEYCKHKKTDPIPFICPNCKMLLCNEHRHSKDHNCKKIKKERDKEKDKCIIS